MIDDHARAVAHAVSTAHHSMAGPLQATLNTMFVLRKRNANDALLARMEEQLLLLREKLAAFGALPEGMCVPARARTADELLRDAEPAVRALSTILESALRLPEGSIELTVRVEDGAVLATMRVPLDSSEI